MFVDVFFCNRFDEETLLGTVEENCSNYSVNGFSTEDKYTKSWDLIFEFLEDHKYKSYYQRWIYHPDEICIDVGSHTEFFYIRPHS